MKNFFVILLVYCCGSMVHSQNLVKNPSFEDYNKELYHSNFSKCSHWFKVNGSPDYYNYIVKDGNRPRYNLPLIKGRTGNGYVGLILLSYSGLSTEHFQGDLIYPLEKGQRYAVEFYVRNRSRKHQFSTSYIGVKFTRERLIWDISSFNHPLKDEVSTPFKAKYRQFAIQSYINTIYPYKYSPQVWNDPERLLRSDSEWMKVEGSFVAEGGEKHLTLGMFYIDHPDLNEQIEEQINHRKYYKSRLPFVDTVVLINDPQKLKGFIPDQAYVYIDDVSVHPVDSLGNKVVLYPELPEQKDSVTKDTIIAMDQMSEGDTLILQNIYFESSKAALLPSSFDELDQLYRAMKTNEKMKIEIHGHTDNIGSPAYNKELSNQRAKAVMDYLLSKGISKERLSYIGFGETRPVSNEDSEKGRAKNRRVAFRIIEK